MCPVTVLPLARIGTVVSSPERTFIVRDKRSLMEPLGGQHMRFDERMERGKRGRAGADLVRQCRDAEADPLAGEAVALPVQRLMLAKFVEQDHRQKVRPGKAARRHMERRRRLRDGLAGAAGEPLTDGLDHLPAARDDLERRDACLIAASKRRSVTSSPSFESFAEPQQGQFAGAAITTRSRGR